MMPSSRLLFAVTAPLVASAYSRGALPPVLEFLNGTVVASPAQWGPRKAEILSLLESYFYGTFPPDPPPPLSSSVVLNTTTNRGYEYVWVNITWATPLFPASATVEVIRPLHCTVVSPCPVSVVSKEHRRWALIGALRGYVAVSTPCGDNGCDGDPTCTAVDPTRPWALNYPAATFQLIGRRAYLSARILDFVVQLPYVRPGSIGIAGHSRNGKAALIAAAIDARFSAVVESSSGAAGLAPYRFSGTDAQCERPNSSWPGPWWLPSLRGYDGHEDELPVDAHAVAALIAPRPLLLANADNDGVVPTFAVELAFADVATAYSLLGAGDALRVDYRPGDHHGYESPHRYHDWYDYAFNFSNPLAGGARPPGQPTYGIGHWPATQNLLHLFNWSAWAALQPDPPPLPAANASALERVLWGLGDGPVAAAGPSAVAWTPGGTYGAQEIDYVNSLMMHDQSAPQAPGVVRADVSLGAYVTGSLLYQADMLTLSPPTPAGWPAVVWLGGVDYNKGWVPSYATDALDMPHGLANASSVRAVVLTFDQVRETAAGDSGGAGRGRGGGRTAAPHHAGQVGTGMRQEEGAQFYARFPAWSRLGQMVADAASAVDLLAADQDGFHPAGAADALPPYPRVDASRIFLAGYSLGGAVALHAAALDPRVAGVATVSGWTPMRNDTDAAPSGGVRRWWQWHATQPRLGWFAGREAALPYDFDDVLSLVQPRPVYVHQPAGDRMCSAAGVAAVVGALQAAGYANLTLATPPGVNALDETARNALVAWLAAVAAAPSGNGSGD